MPFALASRTVDPARCELVGEAVDREGNLAKPPRFQPWEAWALLLCVPLIFVGMSFFLFAAVSHTVTRWSPLPGWILGAAGILTGRLVVGRANRREGKSFNPTGPFDDFRDLAVASRTVGVPVAVVVLVLVVGYAVALVGLLQGWSAAFTSP